MATKTNGAEFKRFYNDPSYWPAKGDTYHDDVVFRVNGEELGDDQDPAKVADTDEIVIDGGIVFHSPFYKNGNAPSVEAYFRRWKKEQTTTSIVVVCDTSKLAAVTAAVAAAGGKILK